MHKAPDAARIAEILRTRDPWPGPSGATPIDLAQRLVTQHRQLVDIGNYGNAFSNAPPMFYAPSATDLVGHTTDLKVGQLTERMSVLIAGLQRRSDAEKQDLERQIQDLSSRVDARCSGLEARMVGCEEKWSAQERRSDATANDAVVNAAMCEARAQIATALSEAQAQWRTQNMQLEVEQREQLRQLQEVAERLTQQAAKIDQADQALCLQEQHWQCMEEQMQALLSARDPAPPPWFDHLEQAVHGVECRLNEQQVAIEIQLTQHRTDLDVLRRQAEVSSDIVRHAEASVDAKLERNLSMLLSSSHQAQPSPNPGRGGGNPEAGRLAEMTRRLDESEARVAALRVRVDTHDGRFGSLAERTEAACQQTTETIRQTVAQQREELLSEFDCQVRILKQRVEALNEFCEELWVKQVPRGTVMSTR